MSKKELVSYLLAQNTSLSPAQILLSLMAAVLLAPKNLFGHGIQQKL